jgi:HTH-type transcriptional regulator, fmd operon transcriptional regulator
MARKRQGLLTDIQIEVLGLQLKGHNQEEIASKLGTTRQNISTIERRAQRNLALAHQTMEVYENLTAAATVELRPGTFKIDVPRKVVDAADKAEVKLKADFTRIFNELRFKVPECVDGKKVVKPITVLILKDGDIRILPGRPAKHKSD